MLSMALEIIKGFFAIITLVQRLAGGGTEFTDAVRMPGIASRTLDRFIRRE